MTTLTKQLLSGSTNGKPIKVAATATAGTLIHTAVGSTSGADLMYLWVSNNSGSAATLTLEWGGVTDPDDLLTKGLSIPANSGPVQVAFGQPVNNGLALRAFSGTANVLHITGYANRVLQ